MDFVTDERPVITLFYDSKINRFIDDFGVIIHDIYRLITPSQLFISRQYKNIYLIPDITNSFLVELIYLDEED